MRFHEETLRQLPQKRFTLNSERLKLLQSIMCVRFSDVTKQLGGCGDTGR